MKNIPANEKYTCKVQMIHNDYSFNICVVLLRNVLTGITHDTVSVEKSTSKGNTWFSNSCKIYYKTTPHLAFVESVHDGIPNEYFPPIICNHSA